MLPGEYFLKDQEIAINETRRQEQTRVINTGDRAVQVGSHFHFFEVNKHLEFDRDKAFGMRLDIPAGSAVRFEPGDEKLVNLVEIGGKKELYGFNGLTDGNLSTRPKALKKAREKGFKGVV